VTACGSHVLDTSAQDPHDTQVTSGAGVDLHPHRGRDMTAIYLGSLSPQERAHALVNQRRN